MQGYTKRFKRLPKRVFYKGHWYRVLRLKQIIDDEDSGEEVCGEINHQNKLVKVSLSQSLSSQWETLLHEIGHASWPEGVHLSRQKEEDIIETLSAGFFDFLITNNLLNVFQKDKKKQISQAISLLRCNGYKVEDKKDAENCEDS